MQQKNYQHIQIRPETHQMVTFRGKDYYMVDFSQKYHIGDFILISEFDHAGLCMHTTTKKIIDIEVNRSQTKMMLIMEEWSSAEEIFTRLKQIRQQEIEDRKQHEKVFLAMNRTA